MSENVFGLMSYFQALVSTAFGLWDKTERLMKAFIIVIGAILFVATGWVATINIEAAYVVGAAYLLCLVLVAPYFLWREDQRKIADLTAKPIFAPHVEWRVVDKRFGEIVILNNLAIPIDGLELQMANYRSADGTGLVEVLKPISSRDGKTPPIRFNPGDRKYFRFISVPDKAPCRVVLLPESDTPIEVIKPEIGVKCHLSASTVFSGVIKFRVKRDKTEGLIIEPWEKGQNAVGPETTD